MTAGGIIAMIILNEIIRLLKTKHSNDIFITECKDGPTHCSRHSRLDAWAMKKSWANPLYIGYEIKISRSDFIRDSKWTDYLSMCNEFYFICPAEVISVGEIPEQAGLQWIAKTGTRIYTKKKAPHREIDPPHDVLAYILMQYGPTGFCDDKWRRKEREREKNVEYWREWLERKKSNHDLGRMVSGAIARRLIKEQTELETVNLKLESENKRLAEYKELANLAGLNWRGREGKLEEIRRMADIIAHVVDGKLIEKLKKMRDELDRTLRAIDGNT